MSCTHTNTIYASQVTVVVSSNNALSLYFPDSCCSLRRAYRPASTSYLRPCSSLGLHSWTTEPKFCEGSVVFMLSPSGMSDLTSLPQNRELGPASVNS